MDPPIFIPYSPPNGLPQESKLATYMNHSSSATLLPISSLVHNMGKMNLDTSPTDMKAPILTEFIPMSYYTTPRLLPESPESPPQPICQISTPQVHQENVGGTTYFYSTSESLNNSSVSMGAEMGAHGAAASPYATQLYAGTPTHMGPMSKIGLGPTFYMTDVMQTDMYSNHEELYMAMEMQPPDLPENVEMYSELNPLESIHPHSLTSSYRATHRQSGEHYALRRLHSTHVGLVSNRLEMWKQIDHPNVIRLHDCFMTQNFGDHSVVLVYQFYPGCVTLMSKYLSGCGPNVADSNGVFHDPFSSDPDAPRPYTHQKNAMLRAVASGALLPESVLWSLLVQLTSALRAIHAAGLACTTLDATKVVMTGCRARIAWCGIADVLHPNVNDIVQAQQDDLTSLGRLALALACRTVHCDNLPASMDLVARSYSADLKNLILYLLSTSTPGRSVIDLMPMIGARFYTQVETLERRADALEDQLTREVDNGRLLRILIKLGVINERPELNMDPTWSETGNRYMLKLFRDLLFHSVTADGRPWLEQSHITYCLNQLDSGAYTNVELMPRDEQSVFVVSFAELKHCLDQAYDEVMRAGASACP